MESGLMTYTIMVNFNRFYSNLYADRSIDKPVLKELLDNVKLTLSEGSVRNWEET